MKTKFVKGEGTLKNDCPKCCYSKGSWESCFYPSNKPTRCIDGYFEEVKPRKRPSKHERLLKALLNDADICEAPISGKYLRFNTHNYDSKVTDSQMKQLIAIKRAMDRKGGGM